MIAQRTVLWSSPDTRPPHPLLPLLLSPQGTWKPASDSVIAGRTIVKARRKGISAPTGVAMPAFNFGATMPTTTTTAVATATTTEAAKTTEAADATPAKETASEAAATTTPAAAAGEWACPVCETANKPDAAKCSVCDEANPTAAAATTPAAAEAAPVAPSSSAADAAPAVKESEPEKEKEAAAPAATTVFGAATNAASPFGFGSVTSTGNVFGSSSSTEGTFSFGSGEASASPLTFGSVPSFGAAGFAFSGGFQSFGSVAQSNSGAAFGETGAAPAVSFEASSAQTLQATTDEVRDEFKGKAADKTGEEDDEVHLRMPTKVYQMKEVPIVVEAHHEGEVTAAVAAVAGTATPAAAEKPVAPVKTETKYVEIGAGELHVNTVEDPNTKKTRARMVRRGGVAHL